MILDRPIALTTARFTVSGTAQRQTLVIGVLTAGLLALFLYNTVVAPRPYFTVEHDGEADYYYNARLAAFGLPVEGLHHPGTPVYYLGALLLQLSGTDLDRAPTFFRYSHFALLLLQAAGLALFVSIVLTRTPTGVVLLTLASVLAWPSFLAYSEYFGPEPLVVALGLPTLAVFWAAVHSRAPADRRWLLLAGIGLGVCLAVKLSFIPVAGAMLLALAVRMLDTNGRDRDRRSRLATFALLPAGAAMSFLIATAPIFGRLPDVPQHLADHGNLGELSIAGLGKSLAWLLQVSPLYFGATALAVALFLYLLVSDLRGRASAAPVDKNGDRAGGVLVLVMVVALVYLLAKSEVWASVPTADVGGWLRRESNPGVVLRQLGPSALGLPFVVLYCYRQARRRWPAARFDASGPQLALSLAGVAIMAWALASYVTLRADVIASDRESVAAVRARISSLVPEGARTAVGGLDYGGSIGEAGFHLWGSHRHAGGAFDDEVLAEYSQYTLLLGLGAAPSRLDGEDGGLLGEWLWGKVSPPPIKENGTLVVGEDAGLTPALIAFPARHYNYRLWPEGGVGESELVAALRDRFGAATLWRETVAGNKWVFVSLSPDVARSSQ